LETPSHSQQARLNFLSKSVEALDILEDLLLLELISAWDNDRNGASSRF
jgi:hypothetical protein